MRFAPSRLLASLVLAAALAAGGCGHLGREAVRIAPVDQQVQLPPIPSDLRQCFVGTVELPGQAEWDGEIVARVIADLRVSEASKTDCGRRLIAFYEDLASRLADGEATP